MDPMDGFHNQLALLLIISFAQLVCLVIHIVKG